MILGAYPIGRVPIGFGALLFFAPAVLDPTRRFVNELAGEDYVLRGRFYRSVVVGEEIQYALRAPEHWFTANSFPLVYCLVGKWSLGMPFFGTFPPISPAQKQTFSFDFGQFLPPGVTLTGTPTVALTTVYGTDSSPLSRITGGPTIGTVPTSLGGSGIANTAILFQLFGCLAGVQYVIETVCTRSDGDVAEGSARLQSNPPGV